HSLHFANSDVLAPTTLETMLSRRNELEVAIVPDQGHAPLLVEPKLIRRIAAFGVSCDVSTRLLRDEREERANCHRDRSGVSDVSGLVGSSTTMGWSSDYTRARENARHRHIRW